MLRHRYRVLRVQNPTSPSLPHRTLASYREKSETCSTNATEGQGTEGMAAGSRGGHDAVQPETGLGKGSEKATRELVPEGSSVSTRKTMGLLTLHSLMLSAVQNPSLALLPTHFLLH